MAFATLIAGPTASGKSALAMRIAMREGGRVVNADSMQVYSDLRILSARPDMSDEAKVAHCLYGFVPAREEFSVGRFLACIRPLIEDARSGGAPLAIVGGTGLYFRALTEGLVPTPAIPAGIRAFWRQQAETGHDLHAELRKRDPERAASLHAADVPRLLRAIELHDATGRAYSAWLAENPGTPLLAPGEYRGFFLDPPRDTLLEAIDRRFDRMMEDGALDEVAALMVMQPPLLRNLGIMKAHGVPHLADFLGGSISRSEATQRGKSDTRRYARRQVIFARKYLGGAAWSWLPSGDSL